MKEWTQMTDAQLKEAVSNWVDRAFDLVLQTESIVWQQLIGYSTKRSQTGKTFSPGERWSGEGQS